MGISPKNGNVLWKSEWPGKVAVIPTPLYADGKVYISSGYGVGCKLVEIGSNQPQDIYENKVMKNHHGGVLKVGNFLYGYSDGVGWACQDFNTGELIWNEKKALEKVQLLTQIIVCIVRAKEMGKLFLLKHHQKDGIRWVNL